MKQTFILALNKILSRAYPTGFLALTSVFFPIFQMDLAQAAFGGEEQPKGVPGVVLIQRPREQSDPGFGNTQELNGIKVEMKNVSTQFTGTVISEVASEEGKKYCVLTATHALFPQGVVQANKDHSKVELYSGEQITQNKIGYFSPNQGSSSYAVDEVVHIFGSVKNLPPDGIARMAQMMEAQPEITLLLVSNKEKQAAALATEFFSLPENEPALGSTLLLAGYGFNALAQTPGSERRVVKGEILDLKARNRRESFFTRDPLATVNGKSITPTQGMDAGDSGGPAFGSILNKRVVYGIGSYGYRYAYPQEALDANGKGKVDANGKPIIEVKPGIRSGAQYFANVKYAFDSLDEKTRGTIEKKCGLEAKPSIRSALPEVPSQTWVSPTPITPYYVSAPPTPTPVNYNRSYFTGFEQ